MAVGDRILTTSDFLYYADATHGYCRAVVDTFGSGADRGTTASGKYTIPGSGTPGTFSGAVYAAPTVRGSYDSSTDTGTMPTGTTGTLCLSRDLQTHTDAT